MDSHPPEQQIAAVVAGTATPEDIHAVDAHLRECAPCREIADAYRHVVDGLRLEPLPGPVLEAARATLHQRIRLRRLLDRLLADAGWREEVRRNPRQALEQYRIQPTPQLVAALKELDTDLEATGTQLDERVSKLLLGL